ncbi:MAG: type II toxin-antitoxin system HipA family toxin [Fibrobacteria bacterium]|nr:type II toxin-antitoxin system HipA family toxin [Fibrobacteria bacterium]
MAARKKFRHVSKLEVHLWGHHIGSLMPDTHSPAYAFRYTDEFRLAGIEPSPLQMPVNRPITWIFPNLNQKTYHGLPALVNDSLPDAFGNRVIDRALPSFGVPIEQITFLDRLAYLGSRAMGALQFKPPQEPAQRPTAIHLRELVEEARLAISREALQDGSGSLKHIIQVGISAGGARPKAVICWNPNTGDFQSGQFDAPEGYEHWLLKFDGIEKGQNDFVEPHNEGRVEFAYYLMATAAGIRMSESRLHEEGGRAHFMTRRFDREGASTRHHVQTLCAMAHMDLAYLGAYSYGQFFEAILNLGLPEGSLEEAYRRMAFNVMARNLDDHTKNQSFLLQQEGTWQLAPAYDLTHAHDPAGRWNHQHFLAVNNKYDEISRADMLLEAERYSIADRKLILDQVSAAIEMWPVYADAAGVPKKKAEQIRKDLRII